MNVSVADTELRMTCSGLYLSAFIVAYVRIVGDGVAKIATTSAPEARTAATCCATLVSVTANPCVVTMLADFAPRPLRSPLR